jgi:hypothetical protein
MHYIQGIPNDKILYKPNNMNKNLGYFKHVLWSFDLEYYYIFIVTMHQIFENSMTSSVQQNAYLIMAGSWLSNQKNYNLGILWTTSQF